MKDKHWHAGPPTTMDLSVQRRDAPPGTLTIWELVSPIPGNRERRCRARVFTLTLGYRLGRKWRRGASPESPRRLPLTV